MEKDYEEVAQESATTNSISCTLSGHSYTGTSAREWKRESSAKPERTSPPWKRTTKRSHRNPSTTTSKAMREMSSDRRERSHLSRYSLYSLSLRRGRLQHIRLDEAQRIIPRFPASRSTADRCRGRVRAHSVGVGDLEFVQNSTAVPRRDSDSRSDRVWLQSVGEISRTARDR